MNRIRHANFYIPNTALVCLCILCSYFNVAQAVEKVDVRHLSEMLRHIHETTGMAVPGRSDPEYPNVVFVDQNFINGLVCKKRNCNAQAATKNTTVFLVDGLDIRTVEGESILYHELVHVAQFHNWGNNENCKSWIKREVQAYQLQDNFVSEKGHDMPWLRSVVQYLAHMCPQ